MAWAAIAWINNPAKRHRRHLYLTFIRKVSSSISRTTPTLPPLSNTCSTFGCLLYYFVDFVYLLLLGKMDEQGLKGGLGPPLVDSTQFKLPRPSNVTIRKPEPDTSFSPRSSYAVSNRKQEGSSDAVLPSDPQTQNSSDYLFYNSSAPTNINRGSILTSSGPSNDPIPSAVKDKVVIPSSWSGNSLEKGSKNDDAMVGVSKVKEPIRDRSETKDAASEKAVVGASAWKPDIHVESFVPDSFQGVNQSIAIPIPSRPLEVLSFPGYTSTFAGTCLLTPIDESRGAHSFSGNWPMKSIEELCPENYRQHLTDCVGLDRKAQAPVLRTYDLFGVLLAPVDASHEIHKLQVPGIREGTPRVALGDTVLLRQLVLDRITGLPQYMSEWFADEGYAKGIPAPGFTGYELSAVVVAVNRRYEELFIRATGLVPTIPPVCNVSFVPSPRQARALQRAVIDIDHEISQQLPTALADTRNRSWLEYMLFPRDTDGHLQTSLPSGVFERDWFDQDMNYEQMVCRVLNYFL